MNKYYSSVDETIFEYQFPNGLKLMILPKPNYAKTEVHLAVKFGSLDQKIFVSTQLNPISFPQGIAHFIEHLLFESEESNPTSKFARIGASVNAYTTYERTNYYFSTTNSPESGIKLLIEMVLSPKFTKKSVEKESKIICQEIQMYEDDYEQKLYVDFLKTMYKNHPITHDIAGTIDSVESTTYDVIHNAYQYFYHPSNMVMVIVGDVNCEALSELIGCELQKYSFSTFNLQKREVVIDEVVKDANPKYIYQEISVPMLMMGVRLNLDASVTPLEQTMNDVKISYLLSGAFGKGAKPYHQLMKKHLINDSFDFFESYESTYGHVILYTETKNVEETSKALSQALINMIVNEPDKEQFKLAKRKILGEYLTIFNNTSHLANSFLEYYIKGINMFEFYQSLESLSYDDILSIRSLIDLDSLMTVVYLPKETN